MKFDVLRIRLDDEAFSLLAMDGTEQATVRWSEVEEVVVYKRDAYASDVICAAFQNKVGTIEVTEDWAGWEELMNALPVRLPGARPWQDVYAAVALPPFATNPTTVFTRKRSA